MHAVHRRWLLARLSPELEDHAAETAAHLLHPTSLQNALFLARCEFKALAAPADWRLLRALGPRFAAFCCPDDQWFPEWKWRQMLQVRFLFAVFVLLGVGNEWRGLEGAQGGVSLQQAPCSEAVCDSWGLAVLAAAEWFAPLPVQNPHWVGHTPTHHSTHPESPPHSPYLQEVPGVDARWEEEQCHAFCVSRAKSHDLATKLVDLLRASGVAVPH